MRQTARFVFILCFPGHNTSLWLKLWRVYYGNMTLSLTNSCKERAKTQSCSTVWLFDLVYFLTVLSLSQKLENSICFELSVVKNVECELKIQTTHFNTVSYSARNVWCRTFMFACWHLPNPPNTAQTRKRCRNRVKKELKVFTWLWKLRHMGLQCGAAGTGWFTFSETGFDGWQVSEKIHLDTRYPGLSTRTLRRSLNQRHSLLMLYICKSQHIVFLTGLWDFGADDPLPHFTKLSTDNNNKPCCLWRSIENILPAAPIFIMYMQYCVCHSTNINSRFVRRQTTPLRCVHRSDLHNLTTHKSCGATLFSVGVEHQTMCWNCTPPSPK